MERPKEENTDGSSIVSQNCLLDQALTILQEAGVLPP